MAAPIPTRNIVLLTTAAMVAGLFMLHGFLEPPWDFFGRGSEVAALASWAVGPCLLAVAALTVGGVDARSGRDHPFGAVWSYGLAVISPLVVLGLMILVHQPAVSELSEGVDKLFALAVVVGAGMALCTLFWQGVVQLQLGKMWPAPFRVVMVTAMASLVWFPFWIRTQTGVDGGILWADLVLLSLMAAIIHELGMSMRFVAGLVGLSAAAAIFVHHTPFV